MARASIFAMVRGPAMLVALSCLLTTTSAMNPPFIKACGTPGAGPGLLLRDDQALARVWLGGAQIVMCTVDGVRGLQKCCEVKGVELRGSLDADAVASFERACEAKTIVPFRPLSEVGTVAEAATIMDIATAGDFLVAKPAAKAAPANPDARSPTKGLFNVFSKATAAVSIFGLADDDAAPAAAAAEDDAPPPAEEGEPAE